MAAKLTVEQKRAKGYVSCGMVGDVEVFLPLNVTKSAARIKNLAARAQFLEDSKAEYLEREQTRQQGNDNSGPIEFEVTPNGRALLKHTGTRRWAFFSKEQLALLIGPTGIKAVKAVMTKLPDSVQPELEVSDEQSA